MDESKQPNAEPHGKPEVRSFLKRIAVAEGFPLLILDNPELTSRVRVQPLSRQKVHIEKKQDRFRILLRKWKLQQGKSGQGANDALLQRLPRIPFENSSVLLDALLFDCARAAVSIERPHLRAADLDLPRMEVDTCGSDALREFSESIAKCEQEELRARRSANSEFVPTRIGRAAAKDIFHLIHFPRLRAFHCELIRVETEKCRFMTEKRTTRMQPDILTAALTELAEALVEFLRELMDASIAIAKEAGLSRVSGAVVAMASEPLGIQNLGTRYPQAIEQLDSVPDILTPRRLKSYSPPNPGTALTAQEIFQILQNQIQSTTTDQHDLL